ncbi:MAG: prepilin-type N-terminal cleavage/methylation domain-containing protein [Gammaproteobacteria bacterium]
MRRGKPERNETGFTLLEILIGLVLLSIMLSLLFGAIRMGTRVWDSAEDRAANVDRMLIVEHFLRDHLTTVRPLIDNFSGDQPVFSFTGNEDSLQFVSDLPNSARLGGLHQFNLDIVPEKDSNVLVAKLKSFYPTLDGADAAIEDVRLISGVGSVRYSYYGTDPLETAANPIGTGSEAGVENARWMDRWEDRNDLPLLIRMEIRMHDNRVWPPLLVNPKLTSSDQNVSAIPGIIR